MIARKGFSAGCTAPLFQTRGEKFRLRCPGGPFDHDEEDGAGVDGAGRFVVGYRGGASPRYPQRCQVDVFVLGGGSTFVDAQYFDSAGRLYHSRFEVGPKFTLGVAVPYGKLLSIETAFTSGPNNLVVTNTNVFPHVGVVYPVRVYIGSVSAVVHAPFSPSFTSDLMRRGGWSMTGSAPRPRR